MDTFEYLSVLISVVVGLGVVHVLQGVGRAISRPKAPKLDWVHSMWVIQSLVFLFNFWWFQLGYRPVESWSSALFMFILLYAIVLYLQCAIIVPEDPRDDYEAYFVEKRKWLYGVLVVVGLLDLADMYLKPAGVHPEDLLQSPMQVGVNFAIAFALLGVGLYTTKRWYHALLAIVWLTSTVLQVLGRPEPGV